MRGRLACSVLVVLAAAACSEPPVKERQQAEAAVAAARTAGAATYDAEDLQATEASLKRYDEAVAQRDYRQALNEALEARERADAATKQATSKRSELRSQADALTSQLETLTRTASARLASPGRPSGAAAERLRNALRDGNNALQEARSRRAADDYPGAVAVLTRGIEPLRRELPASETNPTRRKK
jgi:hypothetical protein